MFWCRLPMTSTLVFLFVCYIIKTISTEETNNTGEPGKIEPARDVWVTAFETAVLTCHIYGFPLSNFSWIKGNNFESIENLKKQLKISKVNETYYISTLKLFRAQRNDNGTYSCLANDYHGLMSGSTNLFVVDFPQVSIDFMKAVGANKIYLNWTVNNGNMPIISYEVKTKKNGSDLLYYGQSIKGSKTDYVLEGFEKSTAYQISLTVKNKIGTSEVFKDSRVITTLEEDPVFIPTSMVKGITSKSITLGWTFPPPALKEYVHFYKLMIIDGDEKREAMYPQSEHNQYVFSDLQPDNMYELKTAACSSFTRQCGNWSAVINLKTMDGTSGPPENLIILCHFDNISKTHSVSVSWAPPAVPNGKIISYQLELSGISKYRNERNEVNTDRIEPSNHNCREQDRDHEFKWLRSNTNYTVKMYGVTRLRVPGERAVGNCTMPGEAPDQESLNMQIWRKIELEGRHVFKFYLPRISERKGRICCYRIFLVKLASQQRPGDLPSPDELEVYSRHDVNTSSTGRAYLAEFFNSDHLVPEIFLGDGHTSFNNSSACDHCIGLHPKTMPVAGQYAPVDGFLDENSSYTSFIEVIVYRNQGDETIAAYSDYLPPLFSGYDYISNRTS